MNDYSTYVFKKSNRQQSQTPKHIKAWCNKCDRYYGTGYNKCPICGHRNIPFRLKKEPLQ